MNNFKTLSIIIPVFNEGNFISAVIDDVIGADSSGLMKQIIAIDDGSTDKTADRLNILKKKYKNLEVIHHKKNEGKGNALKKGFQKSGGDIVLVQDADLEYSPKDYPLLLEPFFKYNADAVYGSRLVTTQAHRVLFFWHYKLNQFLTLLSNLFTNLNLTDMETGSKVFRGDIIRSIAPHLESKRFGFEPEITARLAKKPGIKIFEVGISYSGRTYQEGKKIRWQDGLLALWEIVKYNLLRS